MPNIWQLLTFLKNRLLIEIDFNVNVRTWLSLILLLSASLLLSFISIDIFWCDCMMYQGRYMRRTTIFIFSFCIGLVTKLNGSALGVLKHHYITKRIRELLIGNSRFLIYNSLTNYFTTQYKKKLPYWNFRPKMAWWPRNNFFTSK